MKAIIESVFTLFIMILVGFYGGKRKIITPEINKGLIDVLIQIALPFMIVSSFIFTYDDNIKTNVFNTFYYSLIAYFIMTLVSYLFLLPIKNDKKTILHFGNVFVNTGYVGFPILNSIYGAEGVIYGSIFNMFFVIFLWTYGLMLFKGNVDKNEIKKEIINVLLNPSIIAVILGIVIMVNDIKINGALLSSIRSIGNITGPLSMIIIGVILSGVNFLKHIKDWTIYYGVAVKLLIIPIIIFLVTLMYNTSSIAINSVVIMTAMPASTMTSILAESFNKEGDYAAIIVSASTLISLITVPIIINIIL